MRRSLGVALWVGPFVLGIFLVTLAADRQGRAKAPSLAAMMVRIDERWGHLEAVHQAGFRAPVDRTDIDLTHEAHRLVVLFREVERLPEVKGRGEGFLAAAEAAGRHATGLEAALRAFAEGPTPEA